jgi:hypothetical protein
MKTSKKESNIKQKHNAEKYETNTKYTIQITIEDRYYSATATASTPLPKAERRCRPVATVCCRHHAACQDTL